MKTVKRVLSLAFLAAPLLLGCASPPKAYIPVDSPLKPWEAPEADAYASEPPEPEPEPAAPAPAPTPTPTPAPAAASGAKEKKADKR
jgi:hypothetical protein